MTILQLKSIILRLYHSRRTAESMSLNLFVLITLSIVCMMAGMQINIVSQIHISKRDQWMPCLLTMWKNQWIAHWEIAGGMFGTSLQLMCIAMLNDNIAV